MNESILYQKSYEFALNIIGLYKELAFGSKEYVLSKQILKSGTAIGASVSESEYAQSRPDFIHKLYIAQKEANETKYWLALLKDSQFLSKENHQVFHNQCIELLKILAASIKTAKRNLQSS